MKEFSIKFLLFTALITAFNFSTGSAQSSGVFSITQSVIAGGGGQNSAGGSFALDGTIGQSAAGGSLAGGAISLTSGFWNSNSFVPTAAGVSISGRVMAADEHGLRNALVTLTDAHGATRTVVTAPFGYFRFSEAAAGEIYVVTVISKRYQFMPQVINISGDLTDLNFTALPQ